MNANRKRLALVLAALLVGGSVTAVAHHSVNAQFDVTKHLVATGVLTRVELINPHAYMHFDIKDALGKTQAWSFETAAPNALRMRGIAVRDTFKTGESYKLVYSPPRAKAVPHLGLLFTIQLPDGRLVAMGAEANIEASRELLGK